MNNDFFLKQINDVIADIETANPYDRDSVLAHDVLTGIYSKSKSAIVRISGVNSEYYKDALGAINSGGMYAAPRVIKLYGVLKALRSDIENGYLKTAHEIIQSEIFSDYLEMAEYLSREHYKDAAAVIAGSTLEAHLKELAKEHSVELFFAKPNGDTIPKKADVINAELAKANVYSLTYQKSITAWLGIRNDAAHGNYDKYTAAQVDLMIQGIRQFTLR